jgi:hypothetical protein
MGPFQRELGDPVPLFELVLPPQAAKAAIPVLAFASILGIAVIGVQELSRLHTSGTRGGSTGRNVAAPLTSAIAPLRNV